ncbi:MAG: DUF1929 domain-containing protein [Actinobacteria bacterium]|nr:DUF1929 domain-containing protein [Actinomycetota bacterium]
MRRRTLVTALIASCVAAVGFATGPIAFGTFTSPYRLLSQTIGDLERGVYATHGPKKQRASIARDRRLRQRCAVLSYRIKNLPYCPAPATAAGKKILARQMLAYVKRQSPGTQRESVAGDPVTLGSWGAPFATPQTAVNAVLLPTGKVLFYGYFAKTNDPVPGRGYPADRVAHDIGSAWLWDPAGGPAKEVRPPNDPETGVPYNVWCSGQVLLSDGRVVVAGGTTFWPNEPHPAYNGGKAFPSVNGWGGARGILTFNPWNETWTLQKVQMRTGRWYPTLTQLPDDRVLIVSGWDSNDGGPSNPDVTDVTNLDTEIFTPSANIDGNDGTLVRAEAWPGDGGIYPHQFLTPGGKVLVFGPSATARVFDPADRTNNPNGSWSALPGPTERIWGSAVLVPPAGPGYSTRVLAINGSTTPEPKPPDGYLPAINTTESIDLTNPAAGWTPGPGWAGAPATTLLARSHLNTVILPDKALLTVGGGIGNGPNTGAGGAVPGSQYDGPMFQSEILPFGATAWQAADTQSRERTYHSVALLLPDATVLSAGDDRPGHPGPGDVSEIYSPPYLFKGARPTITSVQAALDTLSTVPMPRLNYGTKFNVGVGASATKFVIVAPGAATHAVDMNQRLLELASTLENGQRYLVTPTNPNTAPPGYYMLFALTDGGVPSPAKWIRLDRNAPAPPPLPVPSTVSPSFSVSPANPAVNATVSFLDTSTSTGGAIVTRAWDLDNDGAFDDASGPSASRKFSAAGTFTVRLQVTDATGAQGIAAAGVNVLGGGVVAGGPKPKIRKAALTIARTKRTTTASLYLVTDRAFFGSLTAQLRSTGKRVKILGSVRKVVRGAAGKRVLVRFVFRVSPNGATTIRIRGALKNASGLAVGLTRTFKVPAKRG